MDVQREREIKLDVPPGWQLPDVAEALPPNTAVERTTVQLESTYFDTAQLDLLRSGLTLRRRTGDIDEGWHLKVPAGDARQELRLPLDSYVLPDELAELTLGMRAGAELDAIAVVKTQRAVARARAADGTPLLEIVVDAVTGSHRSTIRRWREVEVELLDGDEQLLADVAGWLCDHGAAPASVGSKLVRTVGFAPPSPGDDESLGAVLSTYLAAQHRALVLGDLELRRGNDAIHDTRVATRRYRSVLRVFAKVLDAPRAQRLDAELKWYAAALGEVRDRQVLRRHLDRALADLRPELVMGPVADRIHHTLDREQRDAAHALDTVLRTDRYLALMRELLSWAAELPLIEDRPAPDVKKFLAKTGRKVAQRLDAVPAHGARNERGPALHRVRKAAKRARYTAELGKPALGKRAAKARKRMKKLQDRLGAGQDAVVAAEFLRRLGAVAGSAPDENGFTFGILYQRELARFDRADFQRR